ncbi:glycosyl transferase [Clostridium neonatale]|uniref:Glycosyl transferase n=1 Tax=Clostridium neonatale TaxID=137838 RepID=A0A2A7MKX7_9CLOT|nr:MULTISPECIES: glycosyltransferase [Clostridiaceae]MBS5954827.1 glycosyltransferase [Paraclostridium bifermentans]PEG26756.1 glycosyl transferase [Clostridium neonatale]PEG32210.1 glycosyl transferase [Clostridium neonatale]CAH0438396.1 Putative glycosyl transferase [Clostridium neonatale]CAI3230712.1 putative glycosyl transferase [Clostridium neonatale]
MKKVLIIAYYFPPLGWSGVQRTLKFVKYLRDFDWDPIVVTVGETKFSILDKSLEDELPKGIKIIRVDDIVLKDVTDVMKRQIKGYVEASINSISDESLKKLYEEEIEKKISELRDMVLLPDGNVIWANNVIKEINDKIDFTEIDVVYTTSSPYSAHIIGEYIKKEYSIPWIADFRDQWVDNPYIDYDKDSLRYKLEKNMEKNVVFNCDRLITVTPVITENYISTYKIEKNKVITITNGYDEEDFKNIKSKKENNKFTMIHNGSFYLKRNPYTVARVIKKLVENEIIDEKKIEIILNGNNDCNIINKFKEIMGKYSDFIKINGYLSHEESLIKSNNADILLLICGEEESSKQVYTGKVFEYLRLRKPVLSISPKGSLVDKLLDETECGINAEYNDIETIEKIILNYYNSWLKGNKIEVGAKNIEKYERKELTKKLVEIFNEVYYKK